MKKIKLLGVLGLAIFAFSFTSFADETTAANISLEEGIEEIQKETILAESIDVESEILTYSNAENIVETEAIEDEITVYEEETESEPLSQQIGVSNELAFPVTLKVKAPSGEEMTFVLESSYTDVDLENGDYKIISAKDGNNKKLTALHKTVTVSDDTTLINFGLYLKKSLISFSSIAWREIAFVIVIGLMVLFFKNYLKERNS